MKSLLTLLLSLAIASPTFGQSIDDSAVRQKYENTQETPDHIAFVAYIGHLWHFSQSEGQQEAIHSVADMLSGGHLKHTTEDTEQATSVYTVLLEAHQNIEIDVQQSVVEIVCGTGYAGRS